MEKAGKDGKKFPIIVTGISTNGVKADVHTLTLVPRRPEPPGSGPEHPVNTTIAPPASLQRQHPAPVNAYVDEDEAPPLNDSGDGAGAEHEEPPANSLNAPAVPDGHINQSEAIPLETVEGNMDVDDEETDPAPW